jgi:adenosine deaminase
MDSPAILLCTLGATWQVIPEVAAALAPARCPLYLHHPQPQLLEAVRAACCITSIDEIWIVTSESERTAKGLSSLQHWNAMLQQPFALRFFVAAGTSEVTTPAELNLLRELIFRTTLLATEQGSLVCSLAGGRKTMSADLQRAASLFGAQGLLHIVGPEPMREELRCNDPAFWAAPLPAELATLLLPAFVGRYTRRETLDTTCNEQPAVAAARFPFSLSSTHSSKVYFSEDGYSLVAEVEQRERDAQQLLSNYLAEISSREKHENWRHLYRLAPADIDRLRTTPLDETHRELIRQLPKAELHCHLGGLPDLAAQQRIGAAIWAALSHSEQKAALAAVATLLQEQDWPWEWPAIILDKHKLSRTERAARAAALLVHASDAQLEYNLYTCTAPRVGLKTNSLHQFSAYERPGELAGSTVLGHPAALPAYVEAIHSYTVQQSIHYLELRGSPHKYSEDPVAWLQEFRRHLQDSATCSYRFIWIVDRRQHDNKAVIAQAIQALDVEALAEFLVALDLAGDEAATKPATLAADFLPAFEHCLPVTIHAGEGETAENIWQAAYHLHADRIGHGLTLVDHPELLQRLRNRGVCLELCPSSNREVIGYFDPNFLDSHKQPEYPVMELWEKGVALTLNTDNPGISRTTLTNEFLAAARMSNCRLTLWDSLAMIKQGFVHGMASAETREQLLKKADAETFRLVSDWLRTNPGVRTDR